MIVTTQIKQSLSEIGFALILTFIPLGMYAKVFWGSMFVGNTAMALGIIMLFPYTNFLGRKIVNAWNKYNIRFVAFFILSYFYYFISSYNSAMPILTLGVPLATCVALSYTRYEYDLRICRVIFYTWILSMVCVVAGLLFVKMGMYEAFEMITQYEEEKIYDNLTASSIADINICCGLYLSSIHGNSAWKKGIFYFAVIMDILLILQLGKRTPLVVAIFIFLFWAKSQNTFSQMIVGRRLLGIITMVCVTVLIVYFSGLFGFFTDSISRTSTGLHDMVFGASYDATSSTAIRYNTRKDAIADLYSYGVIDLLVGRGYMYKWLDIPLLQSYMDMGVLGLALMLMNRVWLPFKVLFSYAKGNKEIMWAALLTLYGMMGCLTTGTPYDHVHWVPIACMLYILKGEYSKRNIQI